jgi:putative membrane protein
MNESGSIKSFSDFILYWDFTTVQSVCFLILLSAFSLGSIKFYLKSVVKAGFVKKTVTGFTGFAVLGLALAGPLDVFSGEFFSAHMAQHILLAMVGAPILMVSNPMAAMMWSLPKRFRYGISITFTKRGFVKKFLIIFANPKIALPVFIATLWGWHIPEAYNASLVNDYIHLIMHISLAVTGIFFWWPIIGSAPIRTPLSYPQKLVYLLLVVTPTAALAAIITLSDHVIYTGYIGSPKHFGLSVLEDQRIGGLLMWLPGNFIYLSTMTIIFIKWFSNEEKKF